MTELTSPSLAVDDMMVLYDLSATANKKHLVKASATNEGLVEMCTDAEATTGTDETRYINAKQAKDNYNLTVIASDIPVYTVSSASAHSGTSYTKVWEATINKSGTYRTYIEGAMSNNAYT